MTTILTTETTTPSPERVRAFYYGRADILFHSAAGPEDVRKIKDALASMKDVSEVDGLGDLVEGVEDRHIECAQGVVRAMNDESEKRGWGPVDLAFFAEIAGAMVDRKIKYGHHGEQARSFVQLFLGRALYNVLRESVVQALEEAVQAAQEGRLLGYFRDDLLGILRDNHLRDSSGALSRRFDQLKGSPIEGISPEAWAKGVEKLEHELTKLPEFFAEYFPNLDYGVPSMALNKTAGLEIMEELFLNAGQVTADDVSQHMRVLMEFPVEDDNYYGARGEWEQKIGWDRLALVEIGEPARLAVAFVQNEDFEPIKGSLVLLTSPECFVALRTKGPMAEGLKKLPLPKLARHEGDTLTLRNFFPPVHSRLGRVAKARQRQIDPWNGGRKKMRPTFFNPSPAIQSSGGRTDRN